MCVCVSFLCAYLCTYTLCRILLVLSAGLRRKLKSVFLPQTDIGAEGSEETKERRLRHNLQGGNHEEEEDEEEEGRV